MFTLATRIRPLWARQLMLQRFLRANSSDGSSSNSRAPSSPPGLTGEVPSNQPQSKVGSGNLKENKEAQAKRRTEELYAAAQKFVEGEYDTKDWVMGLSREAFSFDETTREDLWRRKLARRLLKRALNDKRRASAFSFNEPVGKLPRLDGFSQKEIADLISRGRLGKLSDQVLDPRYLRVTYVFKPDCGLCEPVREIYERLKENPRYFAISRFREINIDDDVNEKWKDKYVFDIPVIIIEGTQQRGMDKKYFMHRMTYEEIHDYFDSKLRKQKWPFRPEDQEEFDYKQHLLDRKKKPAIQPSRKTEKQEPQGEKKLSEEADEW